MYPDYSFPSSANIKDAFTQKKKKKKKDYFRLGI